MGDAVMKFLTRVMLDKRERSPKDGYAWHQLIWEAFPGRDDEARDFLFRVDDQGRTLRVYVLSPFAPKPQEWGIWETKEIRESFLKHERYKFQLKANPTMRRETDGRRLGLFKEDLLHAWIQRKAEVAGFEILADALIIGAPIEERFFRDGKMGKHIAVDFQGVLAVKNRDLFTKAFKEGIGSAKGFGYGLLMLQPM
jgi:CRISPR system Cascade subunit CasE